MVGSSMRHKMIIRQTEAGWTAAHLVTPLEVQLKVEIRRDEVADRGGVVVEERVVLARHFESKLDRVRPYRRTWRNLAMPFWTLTTLSTLQSVLLK
jgi:hypothetical protein